MSALVFLHSLSFNVVITFVLVSISNCKVEESLYRLHRTPDGSTTAILSDGKVIVVTFVSATGELQECSVIKDNTTIPREFFKEVVSSTGGKDSPEFQLIEVDVRKIGRKCRKYIRDVRRKRPDVRSEAEKNMLRRLTLDETLQGTKWCTRQTRPRYLKNLGDDAALDTCCKEFHTSSDTIPAFTFRHHYMNTLPWPMSSCERQASFRKCLLDIGSQKSSDFASLWFDAFRPPCYELEGAEICEVYEPWFSECKTKRKVKKAIESYQKS